MNTDRSAESVMPSPSWDTPINPIKLKWIDCVAPMGRVLDVGCGNGTYSRYLAAKGLTVVGVDKYFTDPVQGVEIVPHDVEHPLPFDAASFDLVMAWDILEHVNDMLLIQEIIRVLRPGGIVLCSVPHADDSLLLCVGLTFVHHKDKTHRRVYTQESLRALLEGHGLGDLVIEADGGQSYPYLVLSFIPNAFLRFLTRCWLALLRRLGQMDVNVCHGDLYASARKV